MPWLLALAGFADPQGPHDSQSDWLLFQYILDQSAALLLFVAILASLLLGHSRFLTPLHEGYRKTIYGFTTLGIILSFSYAFIAGSVAWIFNN
jgi:hypothetical protein